MRRPDVIASDALARPQALLRYATERAISVNIVATGGDPALISLSRPLILAACIHASLTVVFASTYKITVILTNPMNGGNYKPRPIDVFY
jgi:hypothetical protein